MEGNVFTGVCDFVHGGNVGGPWATWPDAFSDHEPPDLTPSQTMNHLTWRLPRPWTTWPALPLDDGPPNPSRRLWTTRPTLPRPWSYLTWSGMISKSWMITKETGWISTAPTFDMPYNVNVRPFLSKYADICVWLPNVNKIAVKTRQGRHDKTVTCKWRRWVSKRYALKPARRMDFAW